MATYRVKDETVHVNLDGNPYGKQLYVCISDNYDGAPDAGYQPIGYGSTENEAIEDYFDMKLDD